QNFSRTGGPRRDEAETCRACVSHHRGRDSVFDCDVVVWNSKNGSDGQCAASTQEQGLCGSGQDPAGAGAKTGTAVAARRRNERDRSGEKARCRQTNPGPSRDQPRVDRFYSGEHALAAARLPRGKSGDGAETFRATGYFALGAFDQWFYGKGIRPGGRYFGYMAARGGNERCFLADESIESVD